MGHYAKPIDHSEYGGVPIQAGQTSNKIQRKMGPGMAAVVGGQPVPDVAVSAGCEWDRP